MPDFDSREFEWADVKVVIFGREISGLRGLTYKKSQEKELVYAAGNSPKAIQRGNKKFEGSLIVLKSEFDELNATAREKGYTDIVDIPGSQVSITCTYSKGDAKILTDTIANVEFTEYEDGMKQNDKFKEITLNFLSLGISKK